MANIKIEISQIAFEIVSLAGDARSTLLEVLAEAKIAFKSHQQANAKNVTLLKNKIKQAEELLIECHKKQFDALSAEAHGEKLDLSILMIHAQDHLMTSLLLKDLTEHLLTLYGFNL